MKTMKLLFTFLFVAAFSAVGFGQISGSAHDTRGENWNNSGEICIVCHTPHNADNTVTESPLWNHQVTAETAFTPYYSVTLDATVGQPGASSKLCLSCHDGTVALDNYGGTTGGGNFLTGDDLVGTDLSNDHPISFTYDAALATADGGLYDPTIALSGLGGGGTIDGDLLMGNQMECASCHDVHNGAGNSKLLRISNAASALCLTCHNK